MRADEIMLLMALGIVFITFVGCVSYVIFSTIRFIWKVFTLSNDEFREWYHRDSNPDAPRIDYAARDLARLVQIEERNYHDRIHRDN